MATHGCKTLLITCMDYRLQRKVRDFLMQEGLLGNCDIVSYAGGAKNLADGDSGILMQQVALAKQLHHIGEVILVNHTDCGAYGGRGKFSSSDAEEAMHLGELKKAKNAIAKTESDIRIRTFLAYVGNDNTVTLKEH